ncbi:MAG: CRISPR-associated endonuclease Cas2 [Candidatus Gastranaerophilales bacterium]|jgi:CRISPR-associated protein Cas2|nr:CRISPR-associated endonuclease Cas2 [Candidatus Gastranaerophilales bacterium]
MRILIFYDLPTLKKKDLREYRRFRKFLVKSGFIMMQESVYSKLALNQTGVDAIVNSVKKNKPNDGIVQMLTITEKQFAKIEYLVGSKCSDIIDSTDRLVII